MYFRWLQSEYEIVVFVGIGECPDSIHGIPVLMPACAARYHYDRVVFVVENSELDEQRRLAKDNGIDLDASVAVDELVLDEDGNSRYVRYTDVRQLAVVKELLDATVEEITDYDWMYNRVIRYGIFCFNEKWYEVEDEDYHYAVYGLQQIPQEFAQFCCFISKYSISTAAGIGVYRGRSAFFLCAVLARRNKELKYKMIDIFDRIDDFDLFKEVLPQLEKCIPSSPVDHKGQHFDFVFIDADHSYDASINDYNTVGQFANLLVVFHDIYAHEHDHENGGTVRTWEEVMERNSEYENKVFSQYPDKWIGIGCIVKM